MNNLRPFNNLNSNPHANWRYLNTKAVESMLRDGQIDNAEKTVALFTKDGDNSSNLTDMQCMWWVIESGRALLKNKQYAKALNQLGRT